jgi:hypothetical protein
MALSEEYSLMGGLAVGAVVFAVHSNFTPDIADIQAMPAGTPDIDTAERKATIISAGVVAGISLLAKDPTIFVIGSAVTIAMALATRHANFMDGAAGKLLTPSEQVQAGSANTGPAPNEVEPYTMFQASSDFDR